MIVLNIQVAQLAGTAEYTDTLNECLRYDTKQSDSVMLEL